MTGGVYLETVIRAARPWDYEDILKLNEESVHFLSVMDLEKLKHLHSQSELHLVAECDGMVAGFLLALREGKDYDSVNYTWFLTRYPKFLYIDRVVVSRSLQNASIGTSFYEEVKRHAKDTGVPIVTAEIDVMPPNPGSLKFHEKFGFEEVGRQAVAGGKKDVSLQVMWIE
jgi:hypothetical protein